MRSSIITLVGVIIGLKTPLNQRVRVKWLTQLRYWSYSALHSRGRHRKTSSSLSGHSTTLFHSTKEARPTFHNSKTNNTGEWFDPRSENSENLIRVCNHSTLVITKQPRWKLRCIRHSVKAVIVLLPFKKKEKCIVFPTVHITFSTSNWYYCHNTFKWKGTHTPNGGNLHY